MQVPLLNECRRLQSEIIVCSYLWICANTSLLGLSNRSKLRLEFKTLWHYVCISGSLSPVPPAHHNVNRLEVLRAPYHNETNSWFYRVKGSGIFLNMLREMENSQVRERNRICLSHMQTISGETCNDALDHSLIKIYQTACRLLE